MTRQRILWETKDLLSFSRQDKLEHNSSDTESHSETTRVGTLKGALEKLEAENLHLRLQVQTLEESRNRLQTEIKNRINQDSKISTDIDGELLGTLRFTEKVPETECL